MGLGTRWLAAAAEHEQPLCSGSTLISTAREGLLWLQEGPAVPGHSLPLPALPEPGPAMPFGCVTLGDKKDYNQPSEVTDRYDLGQVIKT